MNLKLIAAPTSEPITLEDTKLHLRVDIDDDDNLISNLITSARQYVESFTRRAIASATYELALDDFPAGDDEEIILPKPPLESVTSVKYTDSDGDETTWDSSKYIVIESIPAIIIPAYTESWPSFTPYPREAVKVKYVAGYKFGGDDHLVIPEPIKQAMLLIITDHYENRGQLLQRGHIPKSMPIAVESLLYPYKVFGW
jgi:uncharacterized phiE125 gp8 family phage protein